jgi:hypothetical protein
LGDQPPLCWPSALKLPSRPPKLVYLDMKDWINLSHVTTGGAFADRYREALDACHQARAAGTAIFPLAAAHYMEMAGIGNPNKRQPIADLMEELSGFTTILSRTLVMRLEVDALFAELFGPPPVPSVSLDLLNFGFGPAFGVRGGVQIVDETGNDRTQQARSQIGAAQFDTMMRHMTRELEWGVLAGPTDEEAEQLRRTGGWDPTALRRDNQRRAEQEQHLRAQMTNTGWDRGEKLHRVILAREAALELQPALLESMAVWGITEMSAIMPDRETAQAVVRSMPTSEVATLLKVRQHRTSTKVWVANDMFDIDAMSAAVPYCDIVITDANRWHDLRQAKLDSRMGTVILRDLSELPAHL